jgi:DNA-binding transcriptional LysR family regulator
MLSMRALECLVAIAERNSLTSAASQLGLSQPALSHQIAAIERELGTPVMERLPRGIRPTAAGLAAAAEARTALAAAARAVTAGRSVATGNSGRIRIACDETMTASVLLPVLRAWHRRFPGVELSLREYDSVEQMGRVLDAGEADVTIGPRSARDGKHANVLGREEIVIVASAGHRFACLDAVPLTELAAEPLIHYHQGHAFGSWVDRFVAGRGTALPRPALRTASPRTAAHLALAGLGVAIVPFSTLAPHPGGTVRALDPVKLREVIVTVAAPHDGLLRRFTADLRRQGLPAHRAIAEPAPQGSDADRMSEKIAYAMAH